MHEGIVSAECQELTLRPLPRCEPFCDSAAQTADAAVFLMQNYSDELHINVGTGVEMTIRELAELIAEVAGWRGSFEYDRSKPDGMPRKVMDVSRLRALGWTARRQAKDGFRAAYDWYARHASDSAGEIRA